MQTGSGIIVSNNGNKTVQTIAERNAIVKRRNGMEVTVLDSIADVRTGGGIAGYKWFDSLNDWQLTWKDKRDNLIFTSESKIIANGQVTCDYPPQNGIVFDVVIIDERGAEPVEVGTLTNAVVQAGNILVGTVEFDGYTLKYKYAYGAIEAVRVTKVSQLTNDNLYQTLNEVKAAIDAAIAKLQNGASIDFDTLSEISTYAQSVKSQLDALTFKTVGGVSVQGTGNIALPTKVSDLTNDSGFQTAAQVSSAISGKVDTSTYTADMGNIQSALTAILGV